ncbi:hypothetical protein U1Q18_031894, partial [Sarracenia purpurea var. burkii]
RETRNTAREKLKSSGNCGTTLRLEVKRDTTPWGLCRLLTALIIFYTKDIMGFGSFGNGGLSSPPSNLSALAPPFTVDRSNPKPNSNPLAHLSEPPYAVPYHSSFHNWQYSQSSASRPDLYSTLGSEVDSILTTCLPLANDNPSSASYSVSSPSSHTPPLNPSNHVAAKPYYPQFVSPVIDDDVTLNESCYDLSSTSHVAPLDGFFQVDYAQNSSGLEYMPQWGNFWNRLADGEQGKCVELDRSFCSPEINIAGSFVYKNYMKQGINTYVGVLLPLMFRIWWCFDYEPDWQLA